MYNQSTERKDINMHKANRHGSTSTRTGFFRNVRQLTDCAVAFLLHSLAQTQIVPPRHGN